MNSFLRGLKDPNELLELENPIKKLTLLKKNIFIMKIRKYDSDLKLFWHYHLLHLFCRYLAFTEDKANIKKTLGGRLYTIRKRCWYYICNYTNFASSSSTSARGYADNTFQSSNSRYTQAHLWYIAKGIKDYATYLHRFP